ncbi:MAG: hypothetical protein JWO31_3044 [Phycisphaerales bacterium]|nr:hypothetical protein [Phycisphaerales bacterium]
MKLRHTLLAAPARRLRPAFTLVELLVVIGIIALLISILLPSLNRAREAAKVTMCLTNLRSFGMAMNMYANDNKGRVPIGYAGDKHAGYTVWNGSTFQVLGTMYERGYLNGAPNAYYCPSKEDVRWQYNTPENPWPPKSGVITRLGMTVRPAVRFVGMMPSGPGNTADTSVSAYDSPQLQGKFPQLSAFKDKAIAAEMFGEPWNATVAVDPVITSHKKLINAYYSDNSAVSVSTTAIDPGTGKSIATKLKELSDLRAVPTGATAGHIYLDEGQAQITAAGFGKGMWRTLDLGK